MSLPAAEVLRRQRWADQLHQREPRGDNRRECQRAPRRRVAHLLHAHVVLFSHGALLRRRHAGAGLLHGGRHRRTPSYAGDGGRKCEVLLSLEGQTGTPVPLQWRRTPARPRGWRRQSVRREQAVGPPTSRVTLARHWQRPGGCQAVSACDGRQNVARGEHAARLGARRRRHPAAPQQRTEPRGPWNSACGQRESSTRSSLHSLRHRTRHCRRS